MSAYQNTLAASEDMYTSYLDAYSVTSNDSTDLPNGVSRAIYVGGAGTIACQMATGNTVSFTVPTNATGFVLPFRIKRILATGTTATAIVALY